MWVTALTKGQDLKNNGAMLLEWSANDWYYAVICHACGKRIPFSRVDADIPAYPIEVTCWECSKACDYSPTEFVRVAASE